MLNFYPKTEKLAECAAILEDLWERIYTPIVNMEARAWPSSEPRDFSERTHGPNLELSPGDAWADKKFDCAWFRFRAELPAGQPGPLFARIDVNGELYIVDDFGVPLRGLTCVKSMFEPAFGSPGKQIFELPGNMRQSSEIEIWAGAGLNDLFGNVQGRGKLLCAEICTRRESIRDLYYDLEVLTDHFQQMAPEAAERVAFNEAIVEAWRFLDTRDAEAVEKFHHVVRSFYQSDPDRPSLKISAIGHAHLDLAWLWPIRETIRKGARTLSTVLYNLERYPEYVFGCSQPQLFVWIKEAYPELYRRVKEAVKNGRIELLGSFWVEPDCNLPSGESYVRQVLHGREFFLREFGYVPDVCWQPDVFGYNGQLPQILRKTSHRAFMTQKLSWNVVNRFPYHSFRWEGIDGTMLPVHMLPEENYNGPAAPRAIRKIQNEYAERDRSDHALMAFGIGDGGGGPDAEHLERLRRANRLPGSAKVEIERTDAFFDDWIRDVERFPVWRGELYLERHQGTFTTHSLTKKNNRSCEILLREAEWASLLAKKTCGRPYPGETLDRIWKEVLLYQFHDILPGSSIRRVYTESNARYETLIEQLETLISAAYADFSSKHGGGKFAFNSLPWERVEWLKVEAGWKRIEVPPMGWLRLPSERETPGATDNIRATPNLLENEWLKATFASDGSLDSLFDKDSAQEFIAPGEGANTYLVFPDRGDAWDFEIDFPSKDVCLYLKDPPEAMRLEETRAFIDGPRAVLRQTYRIRSSHLELDIILPAGSRQLEFKVRLDWREKNAMLRTRFPTKFQSETARYEIPFGCIRRSTREATSVERAQLEAPAQQWVDLSDSKFGLSLLNDCKYGFRVKGHVIDMNLVRSVPHPDDTEIGPSGQAEAVKSEDVTDLGVHRFRYALMPHSSDFSQGEITAQARAFNAPLRLIDCEEQSAAPETGSSGRELLELGSRSIEIAAIKQAEADEDIIIRLVNLEPEAVGTSLRILWHCQELKETDLIETTHRTLNLDQRGCCSLEFGPYEVKTIRLTPSANN